MSRRRLSASVRLLVLLSLTSCASGRRKSYQLSRSPQTSVHQLKASGTASASAQVASATKAGKSILLVFTNEGLPGHRETVAAVRAYAAGHRDTITTVVADPEADAELAKRCQIPKPLTQTRVAILLNGRVIVHAVAPQTKQAVDDAYRYALARSRCKRCGF